MTRRDCISLFAGGASSLAAPRLGSAATRPNIILMLADDQGYGDLSCHGNPNLATPNLDRLARQGTEFTRFLVSPVCAPTRSSLLTGRYHLRTGVHGVTWGREAMRLEETTLAEALKSAGYRTALAGKWHLGDNYPYVPHAQGFDEFVGFRTGHWNSYFDSPLERNGKPTATQGYITDALTDEALAFVERNRSRPFFLYLAYNAPHSPYQLPREIFRKYQEKGLPDQVAGVYGMVENLDGNVGRLSARLDQLDLARNTILIYMSDNGPSGRRFNAGLRGGKASVYEGGVRVPFFLRWPGRVAEGRKISRLAAHIDLYPTLLELCGVAKPKGLPIDGLSLAPLLRGEAAGWEDRKVFTHFETADTPSAMYPGAVRTERYTLIDGKQLFDAKADQGEQKDIAADRPEVVRELRDAYEGWFREAAAQCGFARLPIPVGHWEENPAFLLAPLSRLEGGLRFANKAGYAHDWVTGWTTLDGSVSWDIDVTATGRYEVALKYLCADSGLGSEVGVSSGAASVRGTLGVATPMTPKPTADLIPRIEAREMHWGVAVLGVMRLAAGKQVLTVRALEKPGAAVMDLKEVLLRRID